MGTNGITNVVNDLNLLNVEIPKNVSSNGDFAKTFESVSQIGDIEKVASRDINVNDELKTSDNGAKENYLKETGNGRKFEKKVEQKDDSDSKVTSNPSDAKVEINEKTEDDADPEKIDLTNMVYSISVRAYCDTCDVSNDEFVNFTEVNGISPADILEPAQVQSIVMQLKGVTDAVDLITDDELYASIKNLEGLIQTNVEEAAKELGVDVADLMNAIENAKNLKTEDNPVPELSNEIEINPVVKEDVPVIKTSEQPVVKTDEKIVVTEDNEKIDTETENNPVQEIKTTNKQDRSEDKSSGKENHSNFSGTVRNEVQFQNEIHVENKETPQFAPSAQEIYDQIGEYIKNLSSDKINEIELKLQPETLGTIQVKVTQSEGLVKAEFVTSNENVRSVIEGQLIQLKQDFEQSGIKVSEVEVRVSTNEFNENTQQDSRDEANERAQRTFAPRRINLVDGVDLDVIDEYEDEEKIAVEMMTANGNSMDYRA